MGWTLIAIIVIAVLLTTWFGGTRNRLRRSSDHDIGERAETARRLQQQIDEGRHTGHGGIS